jgi:predicted nucleic acid-binding protein
MVDQNTYHLDANLIIAYILEEDDIARQVRKFMERSNRGNRIIIISTNELGEISKRLLKAYESHSTNDNIRKKIIKCRNQIQILGFSDLIKCKEDLDNFNNVLKRLNDVLGLVDVRVQQSDRVNISLFAISEAKTYLTADKRIIESRNIVQFLKKEYDKDIKEISSC